MKKLLIATNLLSLVVIFIIGCHQQKPKEGTTVENCQNGTCVICKNYAAVELPGLMSSDIIRNLSLAYKNDPSKALINKTKDTDALSLSFDLEKIKNFIWHIEDAGCRAGCDSKQELGIRFYYIKYDTSVIPKESREPFLKNLNKHSLAMVPIYRSNADHEWYDFDYKDVRDNCDLNSKSMFVNKGLGLINIDADNHGGLAPPPPPGNYPTVPIPH